MPKASVKRLIECKKKDLIDLVLDIEKYPEFVPFCFDSKVYEMKKEGDLTKIIADLTIGKGPFKDTYKSDVKFNKKDDTIKVTNIGGPLNHLENTWHFKEQENGTEISFDIDFVDPTYAPGTGTPEIGGPNAFQAQQVIRALRGVDLVGADLVEVSPPFDTSGGTAWVGVSLMFELMCVLAEAIDRRR